MSISERDERLYTVAEVQGLLSVGRGTAYNLLATRQIPAIRIGRALRVREQDLRRFIESNVTTTE